MLLSVLMYVIPLCRTPFRQWIQQAHEADYNVVYIPLSQEMRSQFNEVMVPDPSVCVSKSILDSGSRLFC